MKKLLSIAIAATVLLQVLFVPVSLAFDNIELISVEDSKNDIISYDGPKMMLKQDWYGLKFEINPLTKLGIRDIKALDSAKYQQAINEVVFPLDVLGEYKVYFLDYRLKEYSNVMALSFKNDSVVVFGSYWELGEENIYQLAVHEIGHQVDFKLMNADRWQEYAKIRGIEDQSIYNNSSEIYSNRPQEIFAEDFRMLFGGDTARKQQHINSNLQNPMQDKKIKDFFLSIAK